MKYDLTESGAQAIRRRLKMDPGRFCRVAEGVTDHDSMVTSVQYASSRGVTSGCVGRSDDTDARREARRCVGRSDRSAQGGRPTLRSIRPTRARLTARRFLRTVLRAPFLYYRDCLRAVHRNRSTVIILTLTLIILSLKVRRGGLDLCLLELR
jgi:hypothetical protein